MNKEITLHIGGMTCVNCQNKIEKALNGTAGVIRARVSYNAGRADILYDAEKITVQDISAVIQRLDYQVLDDPSKQAPGITRMICILFIIIALYIMLQITGILNLLVPGQLADTGMGYGMLFLIGLITSVHCVAMCGGINLSQCIPQAGQPAEDTGRITVFWPALLYNFGRVTSYTAVGLVLGLTGMLIGGNAEAGMGIFFQGLLKIAAGVFMVIMGVNMLGLFPALRRFTIRMPRFLARRISAQKAKSHRPFYVGFLNGFMPCGPLQSMWLVALAAGNPLSGALSMFLFSLGTVPLMLGLGSMVSILGRKFSDKVMTVGAILVVVLGLSMLSQGWALSGWLPSGSEIPSGSGETVSDVSSENEDGVQVVRSTLEAGRYPNITVQAGIPVKWIIDAPQGSINGCNYKILIRDLDLEYAFQTGENVIEFTPKEAGTIRYSCWMGMIRGNIFVTDGTEEGEAATGDVTEPTPSGYTIPTDKLAAAALTEDEQGNPIQEVSIRLTDQGFEPAVVVVQKGIQAVWNIDVDREDADTGIDLLVPCYATILTLTSGNNQLLLYPTEDFDLAVGDYKAFAYLKVVDDLEQTDEAAILEEVSGYEPLIYPPDIYAGTGMSCCY